MDIATMHIGVKQELDKTNALELPAFEPEEIDLWVNNAIRKFSKTRYSGVNIKGESFEETQKRIDDLSTLVLRSRMIMIENDNAGLTGEHALTTTPLEDSFVVLTLVNSWPSDYWFALSEECMIAPHDGDTSIQGVVECTMDEYRQKLDDPFSEHLLHYGTAKPLRIFNANSVELVTDGTYNINYYYLTYLKKPQEVDVANVASGSIVEGTTYGVYNTDSSYVTYNSNNYYSGETFVGISGTTTYTESGTSSVNTSCDLPEHTHDEIIKLAANMMLENIEQPRYQTHMNEVNTME